MLFCMLLLTNCRNDSSNEKEDNQANEKNTNANPTDINKDLARLEFPRIKAGNNIVIVHKTTLAKDSLFPNGIKTNHEYGVNYSVEWDCTKKSQRWSCYQMYANISVTATKRYYSDDISKQYPQDELIPLQYRFDSDPYRGSGFDHGHICPSADRLCSPEANYQTFFLSNMQPQYNVFNAGLWEKMESRLRSWNRNSFRDTLYICKGGTIDHSEDILKVTSKGLIVPKYFFMAILCKNSQGYKAIGFWVENLNENHEDDKLSKYVLSIRELEKRTGIDFFCNLPDNIEENTETVVYPNSWGLR